MSDLAQLVPRKRQPKYNARSYQAVVAEEFPTPGFQPARQQP